jgi:hypothetical protein
MLTGCVKEIPLGLEDEKIFAACELKANERVIVYASESGNIFGENPEYLGDPKSLRLTLSIGVNSDNGRDLVYDYDGKYYTIDPKEFVPLQGVTYTLRGLSNVGAGELDSKIVMPYAPDIDSTTARLINDPSGTDKQYIEVSIVLQNIKYKEEFFYVDPKLTTGAIVSHYEDVQAYKPLKHKSGFLVDATRIKNNTIKFLVGTDDFSKIKTFPVSIASMSSQTYYYTKYVSDNVTSVNSTYVRPAIVGDAFNISTSKAFGVFGGSSSATHVITVK